jgi:DNA-binding SARP family transcriptional activator
MDALHITLLGSPRAERAGRLVVFDTRKATALLAYLAVTGRPQGRDSLADLLWPDYDPAQARGGLRRTLSVLKSATGGDVVVADRSTVTLAGGRGADVDVTDFRRLAAPRHCRRRHRPARSASPT